MSNRIVRCHALSVVAVITGKWKTVILMNLIRGGTKRFSELKTLIPGLSERILTLHLRELEEQGIIRRIVHPQVPPKVEYMMTEYGMTLEPILESMHDWGTKHLDYLQSKEPQKDQLDI